MRRAVVDVEKIRGVLGRALITHERVEISEPLDRPTYRDVNDVLEALGGKWNRKAKAHLFPTSPVDALREFLCEAGELPRGPLAAKTAEGYVATPPELAARIVRDMTDIEDLEDETFRILEPSCGDGALVRAILDAGVDVHVTAIEPNAERAKLADVDDTRLRLLTETFESYYGSTTDEWRETFDYVVMNPPFSVPDNRTIWIDHVNMAWGMVRPGGHLIAIVPAGFKFREDKRHKAMRDLVNQFGGWEDLPEDAFAPSGIKSIRTVLLWMQRPVVAAAPVEPRRPVQARETRALPAAPALKPTLVSAMPQPKPVASSKPAQLALF